MSVPVIVLNFGHSVLRSLDDYTEAASEIYRHYREGNNVVAVTSAQGDQTDVLMAEARRIGPEGKAKNLPELIGLGERRSAALLALALERIGAPAFVRQARDLGLKARVDGDDAEIADIDIKQLNQDLTDHDIVVMPGFVASGEQDRLVLLNQGGADLTALYVAHRLGVEALLLKDVDGVYAGDPKRSGDAPKRYAQISWDEAEKVAGVLVSPKALEFAKTHKQNFRIGTPGVPFYTVIGSDTVAPSGQPQVRPLRVAMLGCGVVGGGVMRRIAAHADRFTLEKIMVRNVKKYTDQGLAPELLTTDFDALIAAEPDVFIDVSGGVEPALSQTRSMLSRGVHVVSANKQAIAEGGLDLMEFARESGAILQFSSAAGGGMPILEMCLREAGDLVKVEALLNGTTNFMLARIDEGMDYGAALKLAQDMGFAEADPSNDVNGKDAAAKIRLVSQLAFGTPLGYDDIPRDTIEGFTGGEGTMKRIAVVEKTAQGVKAELRLTGLDETDFMAGARNEEAHARFTFRDGRVYKIRGKGAGRWPTTEAVMADLYDISQTYYQQK